MIRLHLIYNLRTLLKFRWIHDSIFIILPRDSVLIIQNCTVVLHVISILCAQHINVGPTCFHPARNHRTIYHNYPSTLYSRTGVRQIYGVSRWIYCPEIIERLSKVLGIARNRSVYLHASLSRKLFNFRITKTIVRRLLHSAKFVLNFTCFMYSKWST